MYGTTKYYNNVVNLGNAQSNGLSFRRLTGTGTVEVYGNTVYSIRAYHTAQVTETPDPIIKNNIFFTSQGSTALDLTGWAGTPSAPSTGSGTNGRGTKPDRCWRCPSRPVIM